MMNKEHIVREILEETFNGIPVSKALATRYNKRSIILPISNRFLNASTGYLDLSNRPKNAIKRRQIKTIGELIEIISTNANNKFKDMRGIGVTSATEIFEALLDYGYQMLNRQEKIDFLTNFVASSQMYLKEEYK